MKNGNISLNSRAAIILLSLALAACGTVTEKTNVSSRASNDPQDRGKVTSGILDFWKNDNGVIIGRVVTTNFKDRYNALIELYGDQFHPPLKKDAGISVNAYYQAPDGDYNTWNIDKAHLKKAGQMIQWKADGRLPTGTFKKFLNKLTP